MIVLNDNSFEMFACYYVDLDFSLLISQLVSLGAPKSLYPARRPCPDPIAYMEHTQVFFCFLWQTNSKSR